MHSLRLVRPSLTTTPLSIKGPCSPTFSSQFLSIHSSLSFVPCRTSSSIPLCTLEQRSRSPSSTRVLLSSQIQGQAAIMHLKSFAFAVVAAPVVVGIVISPGMLHQPTHSFPNAKIPCCFDLSRAGSLLTRMLIGPKHLEGRTWGKLPHKSFV